MKTKNDNAVSIPSKGENSPLSVRAKEAARLIGVSRSTWDRLNAAGKTPAAIRLGAMPFWMVDELREWLRAGMPDRATWEARS